MLYLLTVTAVINTLKVNCSTSIPVSMFRAVNFEVFGRVQGVFFRKYTKEQAEKLGLRGWCKNTSQGTVQGYMEGPPDSIETMMKWLRTTGSSSSKIDKAVFKNQKEISEYSYDNFGIVKD